MISTLLQQLQSPSAATGGGLAGFTAAAMGAALLAKCGYQPAQRVCHCLQEMALADGQAFAEYLRLHRQGGAVQAPLQAATESPMRLVALCLDLLESLPAAAAPCPDSMAADLQVGRLLLLASARSGLSLAGANLELFPQPWEEGQRSFRQLQARLDECDLEENLARILLATKSIGVIGISDKSGRPAFYVPEYLAQQGFQIFGVRPQGESRVAVRTATDLQALGIALDMVVLFRPGPQVGEHLTDILALQPRPKVCWMQEGIRNETFALALRRVGIAVISDRCLMVEHRRLFPRVTSSRDGRP